MIDLARRYDAALVFAFTAQRMLCPITAPGPPPRRRITSAVAVLCRCSTNCERCVVQRPQRWPGSEARAAVAGAAGSVCHLPCCGETFALHDDVLRFYFDAYVSASCCCATSPVVPAPLNGSRTTPPLGQPASMHGSISFGGNVAKCAPLNGRVVTVQTERRLRPECFSNRPLPLT